MSSIGFNGEIRSHADDSSVPQTRRSKGKSRSGCVTCKKRKVKCDELRPVCSRCKNRSHDCVYKINEIPKWKSSVNSFALPPVSKAKISRAKINEGAIRSSDLITKPQVTNSDVCTISGYHASSMLTENRRIFGTEDVFLLTHYTSTASLGLIGDQTLWVKDVLQLAFQNNFLLHAMLTLSARHILKEQRQLDNLPPYDYKRLEEKHLQKTLSAFHRAFEDGFHANQDAILATSFLLCFHACATHDFKPSASIPCADTSFTFLLGTRSIVIDNPEIAHSGLLKELVAPPLYLPLFLPRVTPHAGPGALFVNLLNGLPPSSPFLKNRDVYIERIESLTVYLATTTAQNPESKAVEGLLICFLRWQSFCPAEFVALVRAYDPIALILLAHYYAAAGFVLSRAKDKWWWWQDKPKYMVETIAEYLNPGWVAWMEWPKGVVERY